MKLNTSQKLCKLVQRKMSLTFFPHIIPRFYRMSADFPSEALCWYRVSPARKRQKIIRLKMTSVHTALNVREVKSDILHLYSCLCSCLVPVRSAGSQQQQPCERSRQQTEDAQVQLKQSPHLSFPPSSHPPLHMRKRRWLSPAGSHSMSWRSSSSCSLLQVCWMYADCQELLFN